MVSSVNSLLAGTVFGAGSAGDTFGVGVDVLTAWAKSKAGITDANSVADATADKNAPLAPVWTPGYTPGAEALVNRANAGKAFFDPSAKLYSDLGATGDYQRLFALHTGIATLQALAAKTQDETLSKAVRAQVEAQFARGMSELGVFFSTQQFEDLRLAQGDRVEEAQSTLALASQSEDYVTGIIHKGSIASAITGLDKNAKFEIVAQSATGTVRNVSIDLSQMGTMTRSLSNVVSFINSKLSAAGAASRIETVDQTPKTTKAIVGGKVIESRYTGARQYALKVDVRSSELVSFKAVDGEPAFYVAGDVSNGSRLIKLTDTTGDAGQAAWLARPGATTDPTGAYVSNGWLGAGAPYSSAPANAYEYRSIPMVSDAGVNNFEKALDSAGDAVLKLTLNDGRVLSVSTAWRADDLENWRVRAGETEERGRLDDLAERLTQLLHEQGVEAGVDVWSNGDGGGLSVFTGDGVTSASLAISGKTTGLTAIDPSNMVGGLRDGVFARRFETVGVVGAGDLFIGPQTFTFTTATNTQSIVIDGGDDGIDAAELTTKLNQKLREKGLPAAASLVDVGGMMSVQIDSMHDITSVKATINDEQHDGVLAAPGAWTSGGLPVATSGQPLGDARRTLNIGDPLSTYTGALNLSVVVSTPTGDKTVTVDISALERASDPDSGGDLASLFQDRVNAALNAAGVYVSGSGDLSDWTVAESSGQRIKSITINGDAQTLTSQAPSFGLGGATSAERSYSSAQAATGISDDIASLLGNQSVSIKFGTVWGEKTISASLQPGDPATLESVALRLNEALVAQGYDLGVVATDLSGGGAGLRIVSGASHTIRGPVALTIGGDAVTTTLDPIDAQSVADDPVGAARVAERAARNAAVTEAIPSQAPPAPSAAGSGWFPGRVFDVAVGQGADVATARAVATAADGSVYVLADLDGDSATTPIKGARDVALIKYDSAGKQIFTRILGASNSASGFALSVSADGKVAVAGSVEGDLSGAAAAKGGTDSFVTVFDSAGVEKWTARRGATANDQVSAIAFAPDGSLVVAGKTESALGSSLALGGSDAYVRGYSASGLETFTKQFGTGRDDAATALLVRDNGAGGIDIITGGVEDSRGVLRSFTYASGAGLSAGATRDIGFFYKGAINSIAADGAALYVGGEIGADRVTVGSAARASVAGQDGFVARLDAGLVSTALDRTTYIGSAQDDAVRGVVVVNHEVYALGAGGGVIAGQGSANSKNGFLARLDSDGALAWTRTFASSGGTVSPMALAASSEGASALDVLGLPVGAPLTRDSTKLIERSALRVGDELKIGAEGRRLTTIKITDKDTMATLVASINRAIGSAGRAVIVKENGAERIEINSVGDRAVRIDAGRAGHDALPALGLTSGIIAKNLTTRGSLKTFGLGLIAADLKLDTKAHIAATKAELSAASSIVRQAYEALLHPNAKEQTDEEKALEARRKAAGAAPAYYNQQLANYQAALARLGG